MASDATMTGEAKRVATVLDFHLTGARRLVERMEALEEIAVEQGEAERAGRGPGGGRSSGTRSSATC